MSVIKLEHASFSYDGKTNIFTDLSCEITSSNIFCILGPNGTGKSTLLNGLMNMLPLSSGSVTIDGAEIKSLRPAELARKIAYIPQTYHMVFPFKVIDLVLMGRTPHLNEMNKPRKKDYDKAMEAVTALKLEPLMERSCTQLSGGQLQMVMLARAVAQEADFLILDEPTSHLDYGKQLETLRIIKKMHERGVGILFTSHNPDHAFMLCDKVALMENGAFECVGTPRQVITEENLSRIYGTDICLISYGENGRVCAPKNEDIDKW